MRTVVHADGGVGEMAVRARQNVTTLYRVPSAKCNSEHASMTALLKATGMRLAVQPIERNAH